MIRLCHSAAPTRSLEDSANLPDPDIIAAKIVSRAVSN